MRQSESRNGKANEKPDKLCLILYQLECTIQISLKDPQLKIQVFFTSFDVKNSNGCNNDYLEYYGKKYGGSNLDSIS